MGVTYKLFKYILLLWFLFIFHSVIFQNGFGGSVIWLIQALGTMCTKEKKCHMMHQLGYYEWSGIAGGQRVKKGKVMARRGEKGNQGS